ncbi:MAG: signal recognition particle protein, partial [Clostridia bacterium]
MAVFEGLSSRLESIMKKLRGKTRVTESDVKEISREIKMALLEADVNYKVVKEFVNNISAKAVGESVLESLTPGQQIIKIVNDELVSLLGGRNEAAAVSSKPPTVYLMCGLQGTGKTTTCGKLAGLARKNGKRVMMAACDTYRPAAVEQLISLGRQLDIKVFSIDGRKPTEIAAEALQIAKKEGFDLLIIDTAGRLHIDEGMMDELRKIRKAVNPSEILLVVDSMAGQDAVNAAKAFDESMDITGIILTKLDGDTRGGAALSVKSITGKPIKFACTGEKMNDIEVFHPERMASRILGMGDVLTLIEKAQESVDLEQSKEMERKLRNASFTLDDFLGQMDNADNGQRESNRAGHGITQIHEPGFIRQRAAGTD